MILVLGLFFSEKVADLLPNTRSATSFLSVITLTLPPPCRVYRLRLQGHLREAQAPTNGHLAATLPGA
ncbi:hypothetical protein EEB13_22420 [Rhodococcus sp. WS3]|uniref:hypothetical protein n=1 Tax=Rhodococcus sp. WS3 TaxID=2486271 RepID=UPI0011437F50|nr:hypothetical protein [Rhodococcus sp. WS3]ROZ43848.1 hypothetical protein EEB13_22420 [Rhodococcus sp. WS3]